jgi:hypothetical protein
MRANPRVVIGGVAALGATALALAGLGVAAVIAGVVAAGLLLPPSWFGGDRGDAHIDSSEGDAGGA